MENLTVISGSGERYELLLPDPSQISRSAAALREALKENCDTRKRKVRQILAPFFPLRCRESLEELSVPDLLKLLAAFRTISGKENEEASLFPIAEKGSPEEESESVPPVKEQISFSAGTGKKDDPEEEGKNFFRSVSALFAPLENVHAEKGTADREINFFSLFSGKKRNKFQKQPSFIKQLLFPSRLKSPSAAAEEEKIKKNFSDEVIAAAFHYKWHLEYAASLPSDLLKRCLETAGTDFRGKELMTQSFSEEEIARAVRRGKEALSKVHKKKG